MHCYNIIFKEDTFHVCHMNLVLRSKQAVQIPVVTRGLDEIYTYFDKFYTLTYILHKT